MKKIFFIILFFIIVIGILSQIPYEKNEKEGITIIENFLKENKNLLKALEKSNCSGISQKKDYVTCWTKNGKFAKIKYNEKFDTFSVKIDHSYCGLLALKHKRYPCYTERLIEISFPR